MLWTFKTSTREGELTHSPLADHNGALYDSADLLAQAIENWLSHIWRIEIIRRRFNDRENSQ